MISPTIGRVVWFHASGPGKLQHHGPDYQPEAAIVVWVYDDRLVNLMVMSREGQCRPEGSVTLRQGDETSPPWGPYAEWMPYQKGQAAKQDAAATLATGYQKLTWPRE